MRALFGLNVLVVGCGALIDSSTLKLQQTFAAAAIDIDVFSKIHPFESVSSSVLLIFSAWMATLRI